MNVNYIGVYDSDEGFSVQKLQIFLCMLYAGVRYLLKHPIPVVSYFLYPKCGRLGFERSTITSELLVMLTDEHSEYVYERVPITMLKLHNSVKFSLNYPKFMKRVMFILIS